MSGWHLTLLTISPLLLAQAAGEGAPPPEVPIVFPPFYLFLLPLIVEGIGILFMIVCIVHLIRSGRDWWWLWVILCFPVVGSLIYFFVEILPGWRRTSRGGGGSAGRIAGSARKRIRTLERDLAVVDTVDRRSQLALAYLDAGDPYRARELFEGCLQGMYRNDPHMLYGLARAQLGCGNYAEALEAVEKTFRDDMPDYLAERILLKARALHELGRNDEAAVAYRDCVARLPGVEARCQYAFLLERMGRNDEAFAEFRRVLADARLLGPASKRRDREWIRIAREKLRRPR